MKEEAPSGADSPEAAADAAIREAYDQSDAAWEDALQRARAGEERGDPPLKLGCRAGCAACCTYVVRTTTPEAARIAEHVQGLPGARRQTFLAHLQAWEREWREQGGSRLGGDLWWQTRRKPCPFLDLESYRCGIYEMRPMTCRTHHAAVPPPDAPPHPVFGRRPNQPGEGCFTSIQDAREGHPSIVWKAQNFIDEARETLLAAYERHRVQWEPAILPLDVLREGRRRFGWPVLQGRLAREPLPRLQQAARDAG